MISRNTIGVLGAVMLTLAWPAGADPQHFRFGILKPAAGGGYEMATQTTTIARRLKDTGFRFGVTFDNPDGQAIEWYYVMRLPGQMPNVSGYLHRSGLRTIQTDTRRSADRQFFDDFWFDEGDPLGPHHLELYVNGVRRYSVDFDVVESR